MKPQPNLLNHGCVFFWKDESAREMIEYALLLVFIALAVVALLTGIKTQIRGIWSSVNNISHYF